MEHHPFDRNARFERLQQVPGDRLALPVTIGGQVELVDVLEQTLELGDGALLIGAHDVERFEVGVDIDTQARPGFGLVLRRHIGGIARQVPNVPPRGLDYIVTAQVARNFPCLGGRLDNDEPPHG